MTYPETTDFLFNSLPVFEDKGAGAYKPGLERVREFAALLGDPQDKFRSVHIAGTNGKGSSAHMLAAVLQAAGYRTGLFTSPHLVDFRERIRVDGAMIPEEAVVEFTERWRDEMVRMGLTFFEMATAMAFWWFARSGVEVAVMETGLGGRLDATNIITPLVSVITNIGLEHTQYLGGTIARIAAEKAGIIKPGVPVVIGETDPESERVFRARATELGSPIVFADHAAVRGVRLSHSGRAPYRLCTIPHGTRSNLHFQPHTPRRTFSLDLKGDYQQKNLRTALATVDMLRQTLDIPDTALRDGLQNAAALTGLAGRWQIVGTRPLVVLDTAHNAHGLGEVAKQIARQKYDNLYMVLGFAGDKDLDAIIPLLPENAHYILTRADVGRAMPAGELQSRFAARGIAAEAVAQVAGAVRKALSRATPDDMVYIGGSNFVVGEYLASRQGKKP